MGARLERRLPAGIYQQCVAARFEKLSVTLALRDCIGSVTPSLSKGDAEPKCRLEADSPFTPSDKPQRALHQSSEGQRTQEIRKAEEEAEGGACKSNDPAERAKRSRQKAAQCAQS